MTPMSSVYAGVPIEGHSATRIFCPAGHSLLVHTISDDPDEVLRLCPKTCPHCGVHVTSIALFGQHPTVEGAGAVFLSSRRTD